MIAILLLLYFPITFCSDSDKEVPSSPSFFAAESIEYVSVMPLEISELPTLPSLADLSENRSQKLDTEATEAKKKATSLKKKISDPLKGAINKKTMPPRNRTMHINKHVSSSYEDQHYSSDSEVFRSKRNNTDGMLEKVRSSDGVITSNTKRSRRKKDHSQSLFKSIAEKERKKREQQKEKALQEKEAQLAEISFRIYAGDFTGNTDNYQYASNLISELQTTRCKDTIRAYEDFDDLTSDEKIGYLYNPARPSSLSDQKSPEKTVSQQQYPLEESSHFIACNVPQKRTHAEKLVYLQAMLAARGIGLFTGVPKKFSDDYNYLLHNYTSAIEALVNFSAIANKQEWPPAKKNNFFETSEKMLSAIGNILIEDIDLSKNDLEAYRSLAFQPLDYAVDKEKKEQKSLHYYKERLAQEVEHTFSELESTAEYLKSIDPLTLQAADYAFSQQRSKDHKELLQCYISAIESIMRTIVKKHTESMQYKEFTFCGTDEILYKKTQELGLYNDLIHTLYKRIPLNQSCPIKKQKESGTLLTYYNRLLFDSAMHELPHEIRDSGLKYYNKVILAMAQNIVSHDIKMKRKEHQNRVQSLQRILKHIKSFCNEDNTLSKQQSPGILLTTHRGHINPNKISAAIEYYNEILRTSHSVQKLFDGSLHESEKEHLKKLLSALIKLEAIRLYEKDHKDKPGYLNIQYFLQGIPE